MTDEKQWPTYDPDGSRGSSGERGAEEPAATPKTPEPAVVAPSYGSSQPLEPARLRRVRRSGRSGGGPAKVLLLGFIAVTSVGGLGAGIAAIAGSDGVRGVGKPDAQSAEGLQQLLDHVEERTGGSEVFRVVIYPGYASLDVPVDRRSQRYETLYWDGDLTSNDSKGTSSYGRFDLADVDAEVMAAALEEARSLVEDPESWYASIGTGFVHEGERPTRPTISAYASNEYSESVYVEVRFNGTEVRRYVDGEVVEPKRDK